MAYNFLNRLAFSKVTSYLLGRTVKILLYHSVSNDLSDPYAVTLNNFKAQMDYLASKGYNVISLEDALNCLISNNIPKKSIVLTFDDGFIDFFENVLPILDKYNFKSTVFIVVSEVGGISDWRAQNLKKRLMDWGQLKTIMGMGHSIGSHSWHHCDLTKLNKEELDKETIFSKNVIQKEIGVKVNAFSYPWGICTSREVNSVKKAGYDSAVIVGAGRNCCNSPWTNRFLLKRVSIEQNDSLRMFVEKLGIMDR